MLASGCTSDGECIQSAAFQELRSTYIESHLLFILYYKKSKIMEYFTGKDQYSEVIVNVRVN